MEYIVRDGEREQTVRVLRDEGGRAVVQVGERMLELDLRTLPDGRWAVAVEGARASYRLAANGEELLVLQGPVQHRLKVTDARLQWLAGEGGAAGAAGGRITASMPGRVVRVGVKVGDVVAPGGVVAVLEAMKMENDVKAPGGGRVVAVAVQEGAAVEAGALLVQLEPA